MEEVEGGMRSRIAEGLRFIGRNEIFRPALSATATLNFFNYAFASLFVLYATRTLGVEAGTLGLILGAGAVGGILGATIAGRVGRVLGVGKAFLLGCVLFPHPSCSSRWRTARAGWSSGCSSPPSSSPAWAS